MKFCVGFKAAQYKPLGVITDAAISDECDDCEHKKDPDGGWCHMFKCKPEKFCEIGVYKT